MPTNKKISELGLIGTPARTNVLTALDQIGANVRGLVSSWLGLALDTDLTFSDNTTGDATAAKHGYLPKLPGDATKFLDGTGAFTQLGMVRLSRVVTTGSQASVDFTSISGAFSVLKVFWDAQDTLAGTSVSSLRVRVNNDSTVANYTATSRMGVQNSAAFASSAGASTKGVQCGYIANAGSTGITGSGELTIVNYAGTTRTSKRLVSTFGSDGATDTIHGVFNARYVTGAAPITRLTFLTDGTAFMDDSVFILCGLL